MSVLEQYQTMIRPKIETAIGNALRGEIKDSLVELIGQKAEENVYEAYTPTEENLLKRRYELGDRKNLIILVRGNTITIKNVTVMQSGEPGEAAVVEEGMESYRQPFPRPFMEPALRVFIDGGIGELALKRELEAAGFEVIVDWNSVGNTNSSDYLPF